MSAVFSPCGIYRYTLERDVGSLVSSGRVLFVMLNPSTADASTDDPTIRRCISFARRWGYGHLSVANLYAYRATDPAGLDRAADPVGPENDFWIGQLADSADAVVVAWGHNVGPIADRAERVLRVLGDDVDALALTGTGQPRHPLYVKGDVDRIPYGD